MDVAVSKLKVYGWAGFAKGVPGRQQRIIVAAPSLAEVQCLCKASTVVGWPGRNYIAETGNKGELALALPHPGVFFAQPLNPIDGREWVEIQQEVEK